jgi:ribose transport system substrate-binding protein
MHRGAEAAAAALGVELLYQGPPDSIVVKQVPVVDAVIARKPNAILIAADDKVQLIQPLKRAVDAGITVITVDTFVGTGQYQTGTGDADFPLSYIASDNALGGRIAARALAKAIGDKGKVCTSNVVPGVSTNDQREEGFRDEMKKHPGIAVLDTQSQLQFYTRRNKPTRDAASCRQQRNDARLQGVVKVDLSVERAHAGH